nr:VP1=capsid protein [coxsackievirus A2 CAV-2, Peptide, 297 aa] [Coxsackievirus A2]
GDGIEDAITNTVNATINRVLDRPISHSSTAANTQVSQHSIETGRVPALQAAETGATSNASDENLIETRCVVNKNSVEEASLNHFFSRAALVGKVELNDTGTAATGFTNWNIDIMGYAQLRRKLEMFTYMRFNAEFTFVATTRAGRVPSRVLQYMYVPPGAPKPDGREAFQWQSSTNPSVFSKMTDPPPQVSVPFMSPASAYHGFYDGYPTFGEHNGEDSLRTGNANNALGTFSVRFVSEEITNERIIIRIYMRLKHIRAWVPRPLRSEPYVLKNFPNYTAVTHVTANRPSITNTGRF